MKKLILVSLLVVLGSGCSSTLTISGELDHKDVESKEAPVFTLPSDNRDDMSELDQIESGWDEDMETVYEPMETVEPSVKEERVSIYNKGFGERPNKHIERNVNVNKAMSRVAGRSATEWKGF